MFRHAAFVLLLTVSLSYGQDCKDDVDFCHSIVDQKKCSLGAAKRHCRKSCGHCSEPAPRRAAPTADCYDARADCEDSFYICGLYPQVAADCKQTCEICGQPEPPSPTPGSGCEDQAGFCYFIVAQNKCGLNAAKRQCRKSCGHCQAPVPALPSPTIDCYDSYDDCENYFYVCGRSSEEASTCRMTCELCSDNRDAAEKPME
ncbi:hypothetical protein Tcan_00011 [Toxocara canis]|uniref:ShKT domain-containing protein n=1 Tax=Toxocara canis TaxID=6265 RepID=A0A0B2VE79_TOXCA|nr:hypothetical protein Tcan_00011 [Toxocara canis]